MTDAPTTPDAAGAPPPPPQPGEPPPRRSVNPIDEPFEWPGLLGLWTQLSTGAFDFLGAIDRRGNRFISHLGSMVDFGARTATWTVAGLLSVVGLTRTKAFPVKHIISHCEQAGVRSFGIIALVAFLVGLTLVLQTIIVMESYGQRTMVAGVVGVSMTRELGPLITAIIFTGRVGAAWTAELGTMKVQEEILALETMGINPVAYLVAPRFLAAILMVPCLTMLAMFVGVFGGYLLAVYRFEIPNSEYLEVTRLFLQTKDVNFSMFKSVVFAVIVSIISCYKGFVVEGGSEEVGRATMEAVVICLVMIIFSDTVLVMVFNLINRY
ncbi:MAG: MlaE family ABC transporter permease [Planctomycetota bacterium]